MRNRLFHYYLKTVSSLHLFLRRLSPMYVIKGKYDIYYKIDPTSALDSLVEKNGILPDWVSYNFHKILPKNAVIFDIGANVGHLSMVFAKKVAPRGRVYAFEPDPELYKRLTEHKQINSLAHLVTVKKAVTDSSAARVSFTTRRALDLDGYLNKGLSTIEKNPHHMKHRIKVETVRLDHYIKHQNIRNVDALKVDVEGTEYRVFKGASYLIKKYRPVIIYEYSSVIDKQTKSKNSAQAFLFLKKLRYTQYILEDEKKLVPIQKVKDAHIERNILAIPTERKVLIRKI